MTIFPKNVFVTTLSSELIVPTQVIRPQFSSLLLFLNGLPN